MSTSETVRAWSTTAASNASADGAISSSDAQSPDTLDNNVRSIMAAVKKQMNDIGGSLAAGGTANALTVTTGQVLESGQLTDGLRLLLKATADNTSATVTFAPDGLTAYNIKRADGTPLAIGSIQTGMYLDLVYNSGATEWRAANIAPAAAPGAIATGQLFGLTLSNDGSSPNTVIDIAAGSCRDSTDIDNMVLGAFTKTTGSWAVGTGNGGLDTGSVANSTWYHVFVIKRQDTNVVDVLLSTSATSPTLPTNYTLFRRIGAIKTDGSAHILTFTQDGDRFRWKAASVLDVNSANPGTSAVTATLTVPTGVVVWADITFQISNQTTGTIGALVTALDETDRAATSTERSYRTGGSTGVFTAQAMLVKTNTSAQIRYRLSASGASDTVLLYTFGWIDVRGRLY